MPLHSGTILEITGRIVTKSGFVKREVMLQPEKGTCYPVQFHRKMWPSLRFLSVGDDVSIEVQTYPAGTTGTVNLVAKEVKKTINSPENGRQEFTEYSNLHR